MEGTLWFNLLKLYLQNSLVSKINNKKVKQKHKGDNVIPKRSYLFTFNTLEYYNAFTIPTFCGGSQFVKLVGESCL